LIAVDEENMLKSLLAVIVGGSAGCVVRWLLAVRLNALFPCLPPGTLLVNLLGGFIIGAALAFFTRQPGLDPTWRLLITTGLCGGMTTFSTFSLEVFSLLQAGNYLWAITSVTVHVLGSLLMTALGFYVITLM
jgi:CrcB protein